MITGMMGEESESDERACEEEVQSDGSGDASAELVVLLVVRDGVAGHDPLFLDGLGDDADIGDAGLFDRVHHRSEGAEGYSLIGTYVDDLLFILGVCSEDGRKVVDVDRFVLEKDILVLVNGDHKMFFGELVDLPGLRNSDLDATLEDGGGDHEDEEQDQHDIDKRRDVDVRHGGLGFASGGECHGYCLRRGSS
jgi:hypothetical protein